MKERVQVKHDTSENWAKAVNFIPLAGELIIYDGIMENGAYVEMPRLKVGDGIHIVSELPFLITQQKQPDLQVSSGILNIN